MIEETAGRIFGSLTSKTISDTDIFKDINAKINKLYLNIILNEKKINSILYSYLEYTYKRCSFINTILAPNEEISLRKIYEPIYLKEISSGYNNSIIKTIDANDILNNYINDNIIITDTAGMGKTTFSKFLVLELLKSDKIYKFPIFIELRKIAEKQKLLNYILEEINVSTKSTITETTLTHLLSQNIFLFIFDGFDEISEINKDFLLEEISKFSKSQKNGIILTTRKQEILPTLYHQTIYEFKTLKKREVVNILNNLDKVYRKIEGNQIITHKNFNNLDFSLFETPLMVNLLYVYFSYSRDIDNNIIDFYDELFKALYKGHDLTKNSFKRFKKSTLTILNFRKLFSAFSFISIYNNKNFYKTEKDILNSIEQATKISGIKLDNIENYLEDILSSVPMIVKDGAEYKFVHKTIAEYFAAEYINNPEHSENVFKKIKENHKEIVFKKTFEFLYDLNRNLFIKKIAKDFLIYYKNYYDKNNNKNPLLIMINTIYDEIFITKQPEKNTGSYNLEEKLEKQHKKLTKIINFRSTDDTNSTITISFSNINYFYTYLPVKFLDSLTYTLDFEDRTYSKKSNNTVVLNYEMILDRRIRQMIQDSSVFKELNFDKIVDINKVEEELLNADNLNDIFDLL